MRRTATKPSRLPIIFTSLFVRCRNTPPRSNTAVSGRHRRVKRCQRLTIPTCPATRPISSRSRHCRFWRAPPKSIPITPRSFTARVRGAMPNFTRGRGGSLRRYEARHQTRRYGVRGIAQCAGDAGGALRRRHGRRRAQHHQYPARCRDHRLYARPWRSQGSDRRPRIFQNGQGCAGALPGTAAADRL